MGDQSMALRRDKPPWRRIDHSHQQSTLEEEGEKTKINIWISAIQASSRSVRGISIQTNVLSLSAQSVALSDL